MFNEIEFLSKDKALNNNLYSTRIIIDERNEKTEIFC